MVPTQTAQVLIAGAGPAGMTLAYLLAGRGIRVIVVEHITISAATSAAKACSVRRAVDAFRQMGLGEKFDALPFAEIKNIDMFARGRLSIHATAEGLGRGQARLVSQAAHAPNARHRGRQVSELPARNRRHGPRLPPPGWPHCRRWPARLPARASIGPI